MPGKDKTDKITKDIGFADLLTRHPECAEVFMKHGMHCLGCAMSHFETVEQGATAHGINVDELVRDLNAAAKKHEKQKK